MSLRRVATVLALGVLPLTVCPSADASPATPVAASEGQPTATHVPALPAGWVETEVSFETNLGRFYGTLTHPANTDCTVPATLIIGGSGNPDRDGNEKRLRPDWPDPEHINTLLTVSRWLAASGRASLRYDKLGSGKTGLGNVPPQNISELTYQDYLSANAYALRTLGQQHGIDPHDLSVVGHSEGGLFAMALAAGQTGEASDVPAVHAVASLEGLSVPILDVIARQVIDQIDAAEAGGAIPADTAAALRKSVRDAVAATRAGQPLPSDIPLEIRRAFTPQTYLRTEDAVDPRGVAAQMPPSTTLLTSCSDADYQVHCDEVDQVVTAAKAAGISTRASELHGVSHVLKIDDSRGPWHYSDDVPFSPELAAAIHEWAS